MSSVSTDELTVLEVERFSFFGKAQKHFLRGNRPEAFAKMLVRWAHTGINNSEFDLLIARAVLQYDSNFN